MIELYGTVEMNQPTQGLFRVRMFCEKEHLCTEEVTSMKYPLFFTFIACGECASENLLAALNLKEANISENGDHQ